jgi:hypothetical protein
MDLKPAVSGHFHQIFKDLQVPQVSVAAMEKMETMARMVLMERQLLMHQQQLRQDLRAHKVKKEQQVLQVRQDLRDLLAQLAHKAQQVHQDQVPEHLVRKAPLVHKVRLVQQEVRELLDPLDQPVRLAQQEVQEQLDLLGKPVQPDLRVQQS